MVESESSSGCLQCGRAHLHGKPSWTPLALELYTKPPEQSCAQIVEALKRLEGVSVSIPTVNFWIKHEGAMRSASDARKIAVKRHDPRGSKALKPEPDPQPCLCGCGESTPGDHFRETDGTWTPRKYIAGHQPKPGVKKSRGRSAIDRSTFIAATFQRRVLQRLCEQGRSMGDLERSTGLQRLTIFYRSRVSMERVVIVARDLGLDEDACLEDAGYKIPSLLGRAILECRVRGERPSDIAARLGASTSHLNRYMVNPDLTPSENTLRQWAPGLGLTIDDVKKILEGRQPPKAHSDESRARAVETKRNKDPEFFQKIGKLGGTASWSDRPKALRAASMAGKAQKIELDRAWLAERLAEGLSYAAIACMVPCSETTIRNRARDYKLRPGLSGSERRRRQRQVAPANEGHQQHAANRREVAKQILAGMDDGNLLRLSVRKFEQLIANEDPNGKGLTKSVAEEMLRAAKAMARTRLTIAS